MLFTEKLKDKLGVKFRVVEEHIATWTGVLSRYFWDKSVDPVEKLYQVGLACLTNAGINPKDVDLVLKGTLTKPFLE